MNKTSYDRGKEAGLLNGLRAAVRELLEAKAGPLPEELTNRITTTSDPIQLRAWLITAGTTNTLTEFRSQTGL